MNANYNLAVIADEAFSAAIAKQFGKAATRWSVDQKLFNAETRQAYTAKLKADEANLAELRNIVAK